MNKTTIIYPDGSVHQVTATNCEIYEINGNIFTILIYLDNGVPCITQLQTINGQMYKVPFHDIDFTNARRVGSLPLEEIPSVISTVIFTENSTKEEAMAALQRVGKATYAQPQWLTATAAKRKNPPIIPNDEKNGPHPHKYNHTLYTTYYYDTQHRPIDINNNPNIYQHRFGIYDYPRSRTEVFEKPIIFEDIAEKIRAYVNENGQNIYPFEELEPLTVQTEVPVGGIISNVVQTLDGEYRRVLLWAIPGIHQYTVYFGKTPYKELQLSASKSPNKQVQIIGDINWRCNTLEAFREGFNLEKPIIVGNELYELGDSPNHIPNQNGSSGNRRR